MIGAGPRLGVDGGRLIGPVSGVSRYLTELLREWAVLPVPFSELIVYVPREPVAGLFPAGHPFQLRVVPERVDPAVWTHWALGRAARDVDLLFCPSYIAPLAYRGAFAVTIHDTLPAFMPAARPSLRRRARIALVRDAARRARRVLTPSESTKRDVESFYGVPGERVRAIPLAADEALARPPSLQEATEVRERHRLGREPFVLFVGKLARRRNMPALVLAFSDARARLGSSHRLVLVGSDSIGVGDNLTALGLGDALRLTGHVPDSDLRALYHEAELFVHPSTYEGFGLPVLEAMAAGVPVITIANSSLAEVAGDAAYLLAEPTRDDLAAAIAELLADPARRGDLAERGRARAAQFSWRRTAEETLAALAETATPRGGPWTMSR